MIIRHKGAVVITLLVLIILAIFLLLKGGSEDGWICSNGNWVKHGNPTAPMPTSICK